MNTPPTPNHKRRATMDLVARYRAILQATWAMRRALAGPRYLTEEAAFLPAALSLQHTPVHPAPRRAMVAIVALFVVALAWSAIGEVDIVAVAPGRIVVSDRTKVVQPLEPAVVRAIHVRDGSRVQAGELLVELDPTGADADRASVLEQLRAAESELQRSQTLLAAMRSGIAPAVGALRDEARAPRTSLATTPATTQAKTHATAQATAQAATQLRALIAAEWQDIQARRARLAADATRREAELATAREQLAKLQVMLPLARQREADIKALTAEGLLAAHAGQDRARERIEIERDLTTQQARIIEVEAAVAESRKAIGAHTAEVQRNLSDRAEQARMKAAQLRHDSAKTDQRERLTRLTAPVAGTVQQLAAHTVGGVVTAAQQLMVIVPDAAPVLAEVVIDNKDIGFVHVGQPVEVKLDTFNFTRYGLVPATVASVSADAVVDDKRGAVFVATLRLERDTIEVGDRSIRLSPGMNLSAEIKTGRRRVIDFVLSPLQRSVSDSFRER